jgi:hypothetical protein
LTPPTSRGRRVRGTRHLYADPDLIGRAIATKARDTLSAARLQRDEIAASEAELKRSEAAIERYMHAFESRSVTEDMFGTRVRSLGNKVRALRARHAELSDAAEEANLKPRTAADIEALRQLLEDEIERGSEEHRKAIVQAFVSDLVVKERDTIDPPST